MILKLLEQNVLIYAMVGFCGLGVFLKIILGIIYGRLVKASEQMEISQNRLMQILKNKFKTSYSLQMSINNVDTFVDKYMYKYKFCGVLLHTWENICGQLLILCILAGSVGGIIGVLYERTTKTILFTFLVGIATSAVLFILDNIVNISTKRYIVRVNMKDYLENFLQIHLEAEAAMGREMEQETRVKEHTETLKEEKLLQKDVSNTYKTSKNEEKIIQDILKEYIV